jgi:3,4-dihydroxy 2-butanone 4-phosphate synthase / GTP cyclohydrolase II
MKLNTIEEAIADIRAGKIIIVVDDEDRENEGDFVCAAELVTPEIINFMATYGRGLICTPIEEKRANELDLPLMVTSNTDLHETAFTVSIDLKGHGCTTGISAYDRATGIKAMTMPNIKGNDYTRPGHIFPLKAKAGGVLRRTGHTEAAVDLARLAGLYPAGVVVEIMNEDGTMARLPQLLELAEKHQIKTVSIDDLVEYRMRTERLVKQEIEVKVTTPFGDFQAIAFSQINSSDIHLALKKGSWDINEAVPVKVYSDTETGDILGLLFEGYDKKLQNALEIINNNEKGILLCMRHGEKGNTILQRLEQYAKDATLVRDMQQRDFGVGAQILRELGVSKIKLISDNPKKRIGLIGYGLEIVENIVG